MTSRKKKDKRSYGWLPDFPEKRDFQYRGYGWLPDSPGKKRDPKFRPYRKRKLAPSFQIKDLPPVLNQGSLGSCVHNAIGNAHLFAQRQQLKPEVFLPSRLFGYYNTRVMERTVSIDAGCSIRNGFKSISRDGSCPEGMWPYLISKFRQKPTKVCYDEGRKHQALNYFRVTQVEYLIKEAIFSGYPVVFGFSVYESFESARVAQTGTVPMPNFDRERMLGGHAVLAVGYNDATKRFRCMNSWGEGWGDKGYFTLPYAYLRDPDLSADFWILKLVE